MSCAARQYQDWRGVPGVGERIRRRDPARDDRLRRPVARHKPLACYQINRRLSGWNLPPLALRAGVDRAHCMIWVRAFSELESLGR